MGTGAVPAPASEAAPVLAFVPDLLDRSRVELAARAVNRPVLFFERVEDLPDAAARGAAWVVVDLGRPGVLEVLPALAAVRTVGFASHVDTGLLEAAAAAGVDEVLPRSVFFRRLERMQQGERWPGG
jgi:hypothetical protein